MKLLRYGRPVDNMFDLLGRKEDDMTYALGFIAARSDAFARGIAEDVGVDKLVSGDGVVRLQEIDGDGRTDVELVWPSVHIVLEAKRGPHLPTIEQLKRYVPRLKMSDAPKKVLIAVTNATQSYAATALPGEVGGVTVRHLAWRRIRELAVAARPEGDNRTKHLVDEFNQYLTEILGMETVRSNMVYVVSLGAGGVWDLDFKEVVTVRRRYFFPTWGHWPKSPPNYIAFRYDGKLQTIHHVDASEVFDNPKKLFKDAKNENVGAHYLLHLGPPILPPHEVRTGPKIRMAARVWAMIDLLLTCKTITEARDETQRRLGAEAKDLAEEEAAE